MRIVDLRDNGSVLPQVANLLVFSFKHAWPDLDSALEEVTDTLPDDRISRVALSDDGTVLGWIAGSGSYGGNVWEMHPLVVHADFRGQGVGRSLVADFEHQVKSRGGITITLGTDDEDGETTLAGIDVYSDLLGHLSAFRVTGHHPSVFYLKQGYIITGVLPDANGIGKPDIYMSKRVR